MRRSKLQRPYQFTTRTRLVERKKKTDREFMKRLKQKTKKESSTEKKTSEDDIVLKIKWIKPMRKSRNWRLIY